ncbi:MAG: TetR/AcrR family transcriptional regulator [Halioglobus sp.]|nr:TetR/AcrR family transcriptional regulator [Halioglobus sp.]
MSRRRDQLVTTALRLFSQNGFRATGIDLILREAGVAKKTLYNHFGSKEALVVAVLDKRHADFMATTRMTVARLAPRQRGDPRMRRPLAFFDGLDAWFTSGSFHGCLFINASAEYARSDCPIHQVCVSHKVRLLDTLESLLSEMPHANVRDMAQAVGLLADGAIVRAHTAGELHAARSAKRAVRRLLESYL